MMLEQAWEQGIPLQWVVADTAYGISPDLRNAIHQAGRYYVLGIGCHHQVHLADGTVIALSALLENQAEVPWERLCFQLSEKGAVWYAWRVWRIRVPNDAVGQQWLLVRRAPENRADCRCFVSNALPETTLVELAAMALTRHSIEQLIEEATGETGLADYEVRHWHGWYRHITLELLAHTFLKVIQHEQRENSPLPAWLSLSLPELRCLLNILSPLPVLNRAFRLQWFRWRREHRLRAIASRFRIDRGLLLQAALPP
jgi:hypothetical protein